MTAVLQGDNMDTEKFSNAELVDESHARANIYRLLAGLFL